MSYGIARGLVGFSSSSLRVRIERTEGSYAWVRTADIADAGTPLVLDASQIEAEGDGGAACHKSGLVLIG